MQLTPKQRMINAYSGRFSDRYPVAPGFWYYFPARILGVDMVQFEREIPLWHALHVAFRKYGTEGWGIVFAPARNPAMDARSRFERVSPGRYRLSLEQKIEDLTFTSAKIYDEREPSWVTEYPVKREQDLLRFIRASLSDRVEFDFAETCKAHAEVGGDYLLELWMGEPFFDFVAGFMGFEKTLFYFTSEAPDVLEEIRKLYTQFQLEFVRQACARTPVESFFMGCSFSCASLLGPRLWRIWDKPYIKAIAGELHRQGKFLHLHFHGRSIGCAADFAEMGLDCVCPFERPPGGDVSGIAGLRRVREALAGRVTLNGNLHTVEVLIRGTPGDVSREVREILEAFAGEPRLIVGTGDQVGYETPEENILAMIEEAKRLGACR